MALALPFAYLIWRTLLRSRVVITHRETFTLGFLWYAGLPMLLANLDLPAGLPPEVEAWQAIARLMGPSRMSTELLWGLGIWLAFLIGSAFASNRRLNGAESLSPVDPAPGWRSVLIGIGISSWLFGIGWGFVNRGLLFSGYATEYDAVVRGPLQAALVYTSIAAIIAFVRRHQIGKLPFVLTICAVALEVLLSLSVGTRSMSVLAAIMLAVVFSRYRDGISRGPLLAASVAFVSIFSAIAAWRQQSNLAFAAISPALESMFTYISAATYFAFNEIPSWAFPTPLLGSLTNLVPRALWPGKVALMDSLLANVNFFSPLGAMHLFTSLLINFGWIGSLLAVAASGFAVERLSQSQRPASFASYVLIVAVLTTDIWRNPFAQSLIKVVFQGAILVPLLLALAAAFLALERRGAAPVGAGMS